jgi:hypothetical protein
VLAQQAVRANQLDSPSSTLSNQLLSHTVLVNRRYRRLV